MHGGSHSGRARGEQPRPQEGRAVLSRTSGLQSSRLRSRAASLRSASVPCICISSRVPWPPRWFHSGSNRKIAGRAPSWTALWSEDGPSRSVPVAGSCVERWCGCWGGPSTCEGLPGKGAVPQGNRGCETGKVSRCHDALPSSNSAHAGPSRTDS